MTFHVGQQVVCVDARPCPVMGPQPLIERNVYTVTGAFLWRDGAPCITVAEVKSNYRGGKRYPGGAFRARRFRPVRKTSIEIFQKMLVPEDEKV